MCLSRGYALSLIVLAYLVPVVDLEVLVDVGVLTNGTEHDGPTGHLELSRVTTMREGEKGFDAWKLAGNRWARQAD